MDAPEASRPEHENHVRLTEALYRIWSGIVQSDRRGGESDARCGFDAATLVSVAVWLGLAWRRGGFGWDIGMGLSGLWGLGFASPDGSL